MNCRNINTNYLLYAFTHSKTLRENHALNILYKSILRTDSSTLHSSYSKYCRMETNTNITSKWTT